MKRQFELLLRSMLSIGLVLSLTVSSVVAVETGEDNFEPVLVVEVDEENIEASTNRDLSSEIRSEEFTIEIERIGNLEDVVPTISFFDMQDPEGYTFNESYYYQLDTETKAFYDAVYAKYKEGPIAETLETTTNSVAISKVFENMPLDSEGDLSSESQTMLSEWAMGVLTPASFALMYDHPELSWMYNATISISYSVMYQSNSDETLAKVTISSLKFCILEANYKVTNVGDASKLDGKIEGAIVAIDTLRGEDTSRYNTVKAIHDYIASIVQYADESDKVNGEYYIQYQTPYSVWFDIADDADEVAETVCAGYSKAFKILCNEYGIPCVLVAGDGIDGNTSGPHMWNYVQMEDGNWYAVDLTWDDGTVVDYDYFLVGANTTPSGGSNSFTTSHVASGQWNESVPYTFVYPELNATKYTIGGTATITVTGWTYGDEANAPVISTDTNIDAASTVYYKLASEEDGAYTTIVPSNAGTYIAKVVYEATNDWGEAIATTEFTIAQKSLTEDMFDFRNVVDADYNGAPITYEIPNNGILTEEDYSIDYENNSNAGIATIKVIGKGNYTGTITKTFTINKLTPTITVGTTSYTKTYGDASFTLEGISASNNGTLTYTADNSEVVSVDANGKVTILKAGTGTITVSMEAGENYNAAESKSVTVTVSKKIAPTIQSETKSYFYSTGYDGTVYIDLSEKIPSDCGNVSYTPYNTDETIVSTPIVSNNVLSFDVNSGSIGASATITVFIETTNYKDMEYVLTISLVDKIMVSQKTGYEVAISGSNKLTYGEQLSELTLNTDVAVFEDSEGNEVDGTLVWTNPELVPTASTTSAEWTFTPDSDEYATVTGELEIEVEKITPTITIKTTSYTKTYGDANFELSGINNSLDASMTYTADASGVVSVDANGMVSILKAGTAVITVSLEATENTNAVSEDITVVVNKKVAPVISSESLSYVYTTGSNGEVEIDLNPKYPSNYGIITIRDIILSTDGIVTSPVIQNGILKFTVNSGVANTSTTMTVLIGSTNYEDMVYELTVTLVDKMVPTQKVAVAISGTNELTYGDVLSNLSLSADFVFEDTDGNVVPGTLAWTNPELVPTVATTSAQWTFTPTSNEYAVVKGNVPIVVKKATPTIELTKTAYDVTFGDPSFKLEASSTNPEGTIKYRVDIKGGDASFVSGIISVDENGNVTILKPGDGWIIVSMNETDNYNAAKSIAVIVKVAKKTAPIIPPETLSYVYTTGSNGEVTIDLNSKYPPNYGEVTIRDVILSTDGIVTSPVIQNGILKFTVNSGVANTSTTMTVLIGTTNYEDMEYVLTISLVDKIMVSQKTGYEVAISGSNVLTYGNPLSSLLLNTTKAVFIGTDSKTVEGTLAWENPTLVPTVGTTSATWKFTPTNNTYAELTGTLAIVVNKATPVTSTELTASSLIYGSPLSDSVITGGEMKVGNTVVAGTWSWKNPATIPTVGTKQYVAVFTPSDTENYTAVEKSISVSVSKVLPYVTNNPTAVAINYGQTLSDSVLSGGSVQASESNTIAVAGTWSWKDKEVIPTVSNTGYVVVFTPNDSENYGSVEVTIPLVVNKVTPTIALSDLSQYAGSVTGVKATLTPADSSATVIVEYKIVTKEASGDEPEEATWTTTVPTEIGEYSVRAYLPSGTDNLNAIAVENAVTGTFKVNKRSYGGSGGGGGGGSTVKVPTTPQATIPTTTVVKALKNEDTVSIKLTKSSEVPTTILDTIKGQDKSVTFEVVDENKEVVYSLTLDGKSVTDTKSFNMDISFVSENEPTIKTLTKKTYEVLEFAHSGSLPGKVQVKIKTSYKPTDNVNLVYFNETTKQLEVVKEKVTIKDGYAIFEIDHCSTYLLVLDSDLDLSDYTDELLPVYDNSRVTSMSYSNGVLNLEGYAFIKDRGVPTNDYKWLWREIIFVNEDNSSRDYAYRVNVTPINKGSFLTKNTTLNPTGKYSYAMATYKVSANIKSINNYDQQKSSIAPGKYRVYVRCSDGVNGKLFPLKDVTLSDGTNLENTGKLPAGFEIVDPETRELRLVVK